MHFISAVSYDRHFHLFPHFSVIFFFLYKILCCCFGIFKNKCNSSSRDFFSNPYTVQNCSSWYYFVVCVPLIVTSYTSISRHFTPAHVWNNKVLVCVPAASELKQLFIYFILFIFFHLFLERFMNRLIFYHQVLCLDIFRAHTIHAKWMWYMAYNCLSMLDRVPHTASI